MFRAIGIGALLSIASVALGEDEAGSVAEAFTEGSAHVNFRYRYEQVDQDGFSKDAKASTLKTRVNFRTSPYRGFTFFIEADDVTYIGEDDFNNTRKGRVTYPVVADPDGTDINQAYINFAGESANVRLGRQRINRDNQRFVGGVGWRQNEQTYDAFEVTAKPFANASVSYAYVENVSRIFGPDKGAPAESIDANTHLLNVAINSEMGDFSFYGYAMDLEDADGLSNRTVGARYSNTFTANEMNIPVVLEYARQDDHGDNPVSYSADYFVAEVSFESGGASFGLGYEVLEGSDTAGEAFRTPLATLHKFQGWADKFLATPTGGIEDAYASVRYKRGSSTYVVVFHSFEAETGSLDYGSEWDASWGYKFNDHYGLLAKAAWYDADDFSSDTTKFWLMFTANF